MVRIQASASALASITTTHGGHLASPGHSAIAANIPSWFEYKRALPHSPHSPRLTAAVRPRLDTPPVAANIPSWFEHERALPHSPPSPQLTAAARHRLTISCSLEHPMPFEHERALTPSANTVDTSERFRTRL
ncbi:MAG: hypothetical protein IPN07_16430 [Dehalococcoidia bacterium]|nr:hypothetical protein [Dehalococcoidia bacterium]